MTSKNSFSKFLVIAIKSHIWSIALSCIALFFAMPIYAGLQMSILKGRVTNGMLRLELVPGLFRRAALGEGNGLLMVVVVLLAIIVAINSFSYVLSKQKVDLYHSLPVKRGMLFATNYIAGLVSFVVPYLFFMLVTFVVAGSYGVLDLLGVKVALLMFLFNTIGFIGIYSTAAIAILLTGNLMVSILGIGVFMLYGYIVNLMVVILREKFFITYSYLTEPLLPWAMASPLSAFVGMTTGMDSFRGRYDYNVKGIVGFIIYTALVMLIGYLVYAKRQSEGAGKSMSFKITMPVISVLIMIPASVYGALAFESVAGGAGQISYGWLIFGCVASIVISHLVIQAIYYSDFKSLFKNLLNPLIALLVSGVILSIFAFDLLGYDTYIPSDNKIESMAVSSYELQGTQEYYNFDAEYDEYGNRDVWVNINDYRFDNMKIKDKALIRDFAQQAINDTKKNRDEQLARTQEMSMLGKRIDMPYSTMATSIIGGMDISDAKYANAMVKYTLANGKEIYRSYTVNLSDNMELYNKLYTNEDYKKGVYEIEACADEELTDVRYAGILGDELTELNEGQVKELLSTYREELMAQDAYSLKDEIPVGYIYQNVNVIENNYTQNYKSHKGYVYPSFVKTIALLKEYGASLNSDMVPENVDKIIVYNYNYSAEPLDYAQEDVAAVEDIAIEPEGMKEATFNKKEDIKDILDSAVSMDMAGTESYLHDWEAIDISVYMNDDVQTEFNYALSYVFLNGNAPENILKEVGYTE